MDECNRLLKGFPHFKSAISSPLRGYREEAYAATIRPSSELAMRKVWMVFHINAQPPDKAPNQLMMTTQSKPASTAAQVILTRTSHCSAISRTIGNHPTKTRPPPHGHYLVPFLRPADQTGPSCPKKRGRMIPRLVMDRRRREMFPRCRHGLGSSLTLQNILALRADKPPSWTEKYVMGRLAKEDVESSALPSFQPEKSPPSLHSGEREGGRRKAARGFQDRSAVCHHHGELLQPPFSAWLARNPEIARVDMSLLGNHIEVCPKRIGDEEDGE